MAPHSSGPAVSPLRHVTHVLSHIAPDLLPPAVPHLLPAIQNSAKLLSSPAQSRPGKEHRDGSDSSVLVHKYKTQVTTLLQSKSAPARWSAVVLIKTTIDVGGWEVLRGLEGWVRGLLGILGRPDPPSTKNLSIVTLVAIFLRTRPYPTLLREITTPSLASFITTTLECVTVKSRNVNVNANANANATATATANANANATGGPGDRRLDLASPLLHTVLQAYCTLMPHHPTLFRPCAVQLSSHLLPLLAPTPASSTAWHDVPALKSFVSVALAQSARRLYVQLSQCAPKNTSSEEWSKVGAAIVASIHLTADQVFRAVVEDWESAARSSQPVDPASFGEVVHGPDTALKLPGWTGMQAGTERMTGLLRLLQIFLATHTPATVDLPIGAIMDLITRMLSLTVPSSHNTATWEATVRTNPQIGRDERESLWVGLPQIHTATLQVIATLVDRLRCAFVPLAHAVIDQIIWIFRAEEWSLDVRQEVYIVLSRLLALMGPSLTKSNVTSLGSIIRRCCDDLLPSATTPMSMVASSVDPTRTKQHNKPSTTTNADAFLGHSKLSNTDHPLTGISASSALTNAAKTLLSILLAKIPPQHIKFQLRAQMDRTAILTADKQAMLASVLQPPVKEGDGKVLSSILPHLARSHGGELEVEGLLRPRMPVLRLNTVLSSDAADQEDEEDEEGGEEGDGDGDGAEQLIMTQRDEDTTMPEASAGLTGDDGPSVAVARATTPPIEQYQASMKRTRSSPPPSSLSPAPTTHAPIPISSASASIPPALPSPKRQRVDPPHDVHDDDDDDDDEPFQIPELIIDDPSDEEVQ